MSTQTIERATHLLDEWRAATRRELVKRKKPATGMFDYKILILFEKYLYNILNIIEKNYSKI